MSKTWTEDIVLVLKQLGGMARYKDLYEYFKVNNIQNYSERKDPNAQIRGTIESHSSESEFFKKKGQEYRDNPKNDLFKPVYSIGDGYWALKDIDTDLITIINGDKEGKKIQFYTTRYERSSKNREECLKENGYEYECLACGFNFKEKYGELGKNFIEVHHVNPLSSLEEEIKIDPKMDLVPLCSNCHRMIHRKRNHILYVDELKKIINECGNYEKTNS